MTVGTMEATETLRTSKGHDVPVLRSDEDAARVLVQSCNPGSFGRDLGEKFARYGWSPAQRPWAHKIANEKAGDVQPPAPNVREIEGDLKALVTLMEHAGASIEWPRLRFEFPAGEIVISVAGDRARYPGSLNVASPGGYGENTWYGRIHTDGRWEPARSGCPEWVEGALERIAEDPAEVAAESGQRSGSCSFCGRELTAEESLAVGYGPVCAENYGLPWG